MHDPQKILKVRYNFGGSFFHIHYLSDS